MWAPVWTGGCPGAAGAGAGDAMTDLSTTISLSNIRAYTYDDTRGLLYLVDGTGDLSRWSLSAGAFLSSVHLGGQLSSVALAPDDSFVLVGQSNVTTVSGQVHDTIYRVDTSSLGVVSLDLPVGTTSWTYEQGISDIAIAANGEALTTTDFAGSGWNPFREFPANSPTIAATLVNGLTSIRQSSFLVGSEHGKYILIAEANISDGPIEVYDSTQDKVIASTDLYALGTSGFNSGRMDINDTAGLVVDVTAGIYVFDTQLHLLKNLTSLQNSNSIIGGHFSQDGRELFLWNSAAHNLLVYDTTSWQQVTTIGLSNQSGSGEIGISGDGRLLFLHDYSGIEVVDLSAHLAITATVRTMCSAVRSGRIRSAAAGARTPSTAAGATTSWTAAPVSIRSPIPTSSRA